MDPESLTDSVLQLALKLCDEYRTKVFERPLGEDAYKDATPLDGLFSDLENNERFDSFHSKVCTHCKLGEKLKLKSINGVYFYKCTFCEHLN